MAYLNKSGSIATNSRGLIGDVILPYTPGNTIKIPSLTGANVIVSSPEGVVDINPGQLLVANSINYDSSLRPQGDDRYAIRVVGSDFAPGWGEDHIYCSSDSTAHCMYDNAVRARGDEVTPLVCGPSDYVGARTWRAYDGTTPVSCGMETFKTSGVPEDGVNHGGQYMMDTCANGEAALVRRYGVDGDGEFYVGTDPATDALIMTASGGVTTFLSDAAALYLTPPGDRFIVNGNTQIRDGNFVLQNTGGYHASFPPTSGYTGFALYSDDTAPNEKLAYATASDTAENGMLTAIGRSRGTCLLPTNVQDGDTIYKKEEYLYYDADQRHCASDVIAVSGAPGAASYACTKTVSTCGDGEIVPVTRYGVDGDGVFFVGDDAVDEGIVQIRPGQLLVANTAAYADSIRPGNDDRYSMRTVASDFVPGQGDEKIFCSSASRTHCVNNSVVRTRGDEVTPVVCTTADYIGKRKWYAHDGTTLVQCGEEGFLTGAVVPADGVNHSGAYEMLTCADNEFALVTRYGVDSTGEFYVGSAHATDALKITTDGAGEVELTAPGGDVTVRSTLNVGDPTDGDQGVVQMLPGQILVANSANYAGSLRPDNNDLYSIRTVGSDGYPGLGFENIFCSSASASHCVHNRTVRARGDEVTPLVCGGADLIHDRSWHAHDGTIVVECGRELFKTSGVPEDGVNHGGEYRMETCANGEAALVRRYGVSGDGEFYVGTDPATDAVIITASGGVTTFLSDAAAFYVTPPGDLFIVNGNTQIRDGNLTLQNTGGYHASFPPTSGYTGFALYSDDTAPNEKLAYASASDTAGSGVLTAVGRSRGTCLLPTNVQDGDTVSLNEDKIYYDSAQRLCSSETVLVSGAPSGTSYACETYHSTCGAEEIVPVVRYGVDGDGKFYTAVDTEIRDGNHTIQNSGGYDASFASLGITGGFRLFGDATTHATNHIMAAAGANNTACIRQAVGRSQGTCLAPTDALSADIILSREEYMYYNGAHRMCCDELTYVSGVPGAASYACGKYTRTCATGETFPEIRYGIYGDGNFFVGTDYINDALLIKTDGAGQATLEPAAGDLAIASGVNATGELRSSDVGTEYTMPLTGAVVAATYKVRVWRVGGEVHMYLPNEVDTPPVAAQLTMDFSALPAELTPWMDHYGITMIYDNGVATLGAYHCNTTTSVITFGLGSNMGVFTAANYGGLAPVVITYPVTGP